jgi:hypothetical protein
VRGVTLRAVEADDRDAVNALVRDHGFKTRSAAGWRWLFGGPPRAAPAVAGWVLEQEGELRGYLGNHVLAYVRGGQELVAATCSSLYVHPAARAASASLMRVWLRQPGVALFLSTTANEASRGVYELYGARSPAEPCFREGYIWAADEGDLLREGLERLGAPPGAARALGRTLGPVARGVGGVTRVTRPRATRFRGEVREVAPRDVGAAFDALARRLRATGALQVSRDAAALRWYLSDPDATAAPCVLGAFDAEGLAAYTIGGRHCAPGRRVSELRVLDLAFRPDAADAVGPLLAGLVARAREVGAGLVYCPPCGPQLAPVLRAHRPYLHPLAHARHYLRAGDAAIQAELDRPGAWHATGLDGDSPFALVG